jgi:chemotaxis protein CheY-P-specific phosphatase CheC
MTTLPTARQEDALRELAHLGSAQGASMLARLVGDVGVLVDVPIVLRANTWQLAWLLGGRDVHVVAATFGVEGELSGQLWWVLKQEDAQRLGRRLLKRPGLSGPLSANVAAALSEAANIVASAALDAIGGFVKLSVLPSTPSMLDTTVSALVGPPDSVERTVIAASFVSTEGAAFSGWLVLLLDDESFDTVLKRLKLPRDDAR